MANAFGDVIGADGELLGAPRGEEGELLATDLLIAAAARVANPSIRPTGNTTLACVCTDASIDKRGCAIVARIASAGIARAVIPPSPRRRRRDLLSRLGNRASGAPGLAASWSLTVLGTVAATVTAAAIRDAVHQAQ